MTASVNDALARLDESISYLKRLGRSHETSIVVSVAVFDKSSGEVNERLYCTGFADIIAIQIKELYKHLGRLSQEKCQCGRIILEPKRAKNNQGKQGRIKVKPPHE